MTKFKAKNENQTSFYQHYYRRKYKNEAFPENNALGPQGIVDFLFAERNLYGRVDQNLNVVVPNIEKIKRIDSRDNPSGIVATNFVIDQFEEFSRTFERALSSRKIRQNDPYLSKIVVQRSFENPKTHYDNYMSEIMTNFDNLFIDRKNVITAEQYYNEFLRYIEQITPTFPLTYTAWQRSKESSIFTTGLALDIGGLNVGNDVLKEAFINSENFSFYLNTCNNFGFSVTMNSPWIIVADLASPASKSYHTNNGLSNIIDIFSQNFVKTSDFDIEFLKINLFNAYNNFVNRHNYEKQIRVCKNNKTIKNNIFRNNINLNTFNSIFNDIYFIEYYNRIRYFEEESGFAISDRDKFTRNAKNLQKTFDNERAIGYINEQYRSVYKSKPGGLNSILKRLRAKESTAEDLGQQKGVSVQSTGPSNDRGGSSGY